MDKFAQADVSKPVAILTAWRGELDKPYPDMERRKRNDGANEKLKRNLKQRGLSYYPVIGAGQEERDGVRITNKENSLLVQPVGEMDNEAFLAHIKELLYNPTGEPGGERLAQWGAAVKLPGDEQTHLLHSHGDVGRNPSDYNQNFAIGNSAKLRTADDPNYTQMKYGPRATPEMLDATDKPTDVGNIKGQPGRRFTIKPS
jgi:hypothetical protein